LLFFQRYCQSKGELPLRVTFMVDDTLERIRPKMHRTTSVSESDEAITKLLQSERENLDLSEEGVEQEEAGDDSSEEEESESSSGSDSDSSSGEGSESEEDESDSESDQEDEDYARGAEAHQKMASEIDDFDKEVQQMLIESLEREKHAPRGNALTDLPTPPPAAKRPEGTVQPGMFSLLGRPRGGKTVMKQIEIPEDSKLARVKDSVGQEESKEREEMKRYIISNYDQAAPTSGSGRMMIAHHGGFKGGKGGKGGAFAFQPRVRQDDMLPENEDDLPEPPARVRIVQGGLGGRGAGRSGGKGGIASGRGSGPPPGGSTGKGGGSNRRRPEGKGTPSDPRVRGSL